MNQRGKNQKFSQNSEKSQKIKTMQEMMNAMEINNNTPV